MQKSSEEIYCVYTLRYPMGHPYAFTPFYVGMAADLYKRFWQHLQTEGGNEEKNTIIGELKASGFVPIMHRECTCGGKKLAEQVEACTIEYYRAWGCPLTNRTLSLSSGTGYGRFIAEDEKLYLVTMKEFFSPFSRLVFRLGALIFPWHRHDYQSFKTDYWYYQMLRARPFLVPLLGLSATDTKKVAIPHNYRKHASSYVDGYSIGESFAKRGDTVLSMEDVWALVNQNRYCLETEEQRKALVAGAKEGFDIRKKFPLTTEVGDH